MLSPCNEAFIFDGYRVLIILVQPAYHSKKNEEGYPEACSCAICPLKTEFRGPAEPSDPGMMLYLPFTQIRCLVIKLFLNLSGVEKEDIIDEVLIYFRANVLFRNFDVRGGADKTLIYLTLHAVQCLVKLEKIEDKNAGKAKRNFITCDPVTVK
jgi:actin related protein 2/3 complex subunit 3